MNEDIPSVRDALEQEKILKELEWEATNPEPPYVQII
jgi:hypothetical protein